MESWHEGIKVSFLIRIFHHSSFINSIDSESKLKKELNSLEKLVEKDESLFKKIYLYTFPYAKSEGQKSMQTEVWSWIICFQTWTYLLFKVAVALWQILLVNRYPIVQSFIQFIEVNTKKKIKQYHLTITKRKKNQ